MILKTRNHLNSKFIAKLMCAMDERVYLWLKECSIQHSVVDTNTDLVNFDTLIADIQFNRFNYFLPPSVVQASKDSNKKGRVEDEADQIKNSNLMKEWRLREGESWDSFKGKTIDGPTLALGCKPCLKWHVKGIGYSDCKHKLSHRQ